MSIARANDRDDPQGETDRQADAMRDRLRNDVASWSKARQDGAAGLPVAPAVPGPKPASARPAASKARLPAASKPTEAPSKPFRMSYSSSSADDYIEYMRDRGAR